MNLKTKVIKWLLEQPFSEEYLYETSKDVSRNDFYEQELNELVLDLKSYGYTSTYTIEHSYVAPELFQCDCPIDIVKIKIRKT